MGNVFSNWDDKGDDLLGTEPKEPVEPVEASDGGLEKVVGSIAAEIGNSVKTEMVPPPADDRAKHPTDEKGEILTKERVENAVMNGSEVKAEATMSAEKETALKEELPPSNVITPVDEPKKDQEAINEPKEEGESIVVNEPKKEEAATNEPNAEETKKEDASIGVNSANEPKNEEVAGNEAKAEEPKDEEAKDEEVKEEPKGEEAKEEEPKGEEVKEEPKGEEVKEEEPKGEEANEEEAKEEEPKAQEPKTEEVKEAEPKGEEPKAEGNSAKQPKIPEVPVGPKPPTVTPVVTAVGPKDGVLHPVQEKQKGGAVPKMKKSRIVNVTPVALEPKKAGTRRVRKKRTE